MVPLILLPLVPVDYFTLPGGPFCSIACQIFPTLDHFVRGRGTAARVLTPPVLRWRVPASSSAAAAPARAAAAAAAAAAAVAVAAVLLVPLVIRLALAAAARARAIGVIGRVTVTVTMPVTQTPGLGRAESPEL